MNENRTRRWLAVATLALTVAPLLSQLVTSPLFLQSPIPMFDATLIFEWGTTFIALTTLILAVAYYSTVKDILVLHVSVVLFVTGCSYPAQNLLLGLFTELPPTWVSSQLWFIDQMLSPLVVVIGCSALLRSKLPWHDSVLRLVIVLLCAFFLPMMATARSSSSGVSYLPGFIGPTAILVLLLYLGLVLFFSRQRAFISGSLFNQSILFAAVPWGTEMLLLSFGSPLDFDSLADKSRYLELIGYSICFLALASDFARALNHKTNSLAQALEQQELLLRESTAATEHSAHLRSELSASQENAEKLRRSEEKYRNLVETSSCLIWSVDQAGCWTFVNRDAASRIFGLEPEEMLGRHFKEFSDPSCRETDLLTFDELRKGVPVYDYETISIRKDGTPVVLRYNAIPLFDERGQFIGTTGTATDVTQLKLTELQIKRQSEFFRQVIDLNPNLIFTKDKQGRFTLANQALATIYGASVEEIIGRSDADYNANSAELDHFRENDLQVLNERRGLFIQEEQVTDSRGVIHWFQTVKRPIVHPETGEWQVLGVASEITQRKLAEEALRKSEEQTRVIVDTAADAIVTVRSDGVIASANPATELLFGWSAGELLGSNICALLANPSAEELTKFINHEKVSQPTSELSYFRSEMKGRRKNGECFPMEVSVSSWDHPSSDFTAIIRDVTERKKAEETLQLSERRLRRQNNVLLELARSKKVTSGDLQSALEEIVFASCRTLETDRVGIWFFSPGKKILRNAISYLRDTGEFFVDSPICYDDYEPYFTAIQSERALSVRHAQSDPRTACLNEAYLRPRNVQSLLDAPIRLGAEVIGIICHEHYGATRDWTLDEQFFAGSMSDLVALSVEARDRVRDAVKLEEQAALLDLTQDAIIVLDENCCIQYWNTPACNLYGWSKDEALGMHYSRLLKDHVGLELLDQLPTTAASCARCEMMHVSKFGKELIVETRVSRISQTNADSHSLLVVNTDISEKKKLEEEMLRATKLESVGVLAGGIAHDFNNILTGIVGNISLLKLDVANSTALRERLDSIEIASRRAKELTQQLLTFSKGGSPVRRATSAADLIKETADFALRSSNSRYTLNYEADLLAIDVDEGQISQVIQNLLLNAVQAMPKGGTISISAKNIRIQEDLERVSGMLPPGRYVEIIVRDEGVGIPTENLNRIFDPFFSTKESGSGLGLATSYSIIRKHGGQISVESELDRGTAFRILLPASEEVVKQEILIEKQTQHGSGRILVMDDEEIVREITSEMLGRLGYRVVSVNHGEEAISACIAAANQAERFDIALLDLTVPGGLGGAESAPKLKALAPQMKLIASSGYADNEVMANPHEFGFDAVISKPYRLEELSLLIASLLTKQPEMVPPTSDALDATSSGMLTH